MRVSVQNDLVLPYFFPFLCLIIHSLYYYHVCTYVRTYVCILYQFEDAHVESTASLVVRYGVVIDIQRTVSLYSSLLLNLLHTTYVFIHVTYVHVQSVCTSNSICTFILVTSMSIVMTTFSDSITVALV